jgi:hypothetical protein
VASLAAREMEKAGLAGAGELEGLVYLTILATGAWSTLGALVLPHALGFTSDPSRRRAVVVGAHALTETLARLLAAAGRTTVVIDSVPWRLDRFRSAGLPTVVGDARDAITYEEAGVERDSLVVAATTNDELNLLVAELVRSEFGVEHPVVALQQPPEDLGRRSRAWVDLLGGAGVDVPRWMRRVESDQAHLLEIDPGQEESLALLHSVEREHSGSVLRLVGHRGGEVVLEVSDGQIDQLDRLVVLVAEGRPRELLDPARVPVDGTSSAADDPG